MALRRNIIFNGLANVGSRGVRIAEQLLLVPFFLNSWGAAYYGEWLTLTIIPSVLAFSDLGFGSSASNAFVLTYASGDKHKAANVFKTGLCITSATVVLGVLISIIVMLIANYSGLLNKSLIPPTDAIFALVALMASKLVNFYTQLFEALYRARHKAAISTNLATLNGLFNIGAGIFVLLLGYKIVVYAFVQFCVAVVFITCYCIYGRYQIQDLPNGSYDKNEAKTIFGKGLGYMMTPIWQSIYFQGSTFVVRIVLGPTAVAVFNTVRTVCRSANAAFSTINGAIYPELQIAFGKGDIKIVRKIYTMAMKMVFILAVACVIFLIVFGPQLYRWWTHDKLSVTNPIWYIFMLGILFNALWWTSGTIFRAINKPMRFSLYGFIAASVSTGLTFLLSYPWGLAGAAIGFVSMDFLMFLLVLPLANKEIGISLYSLLNIRKWKS